MKPNLTKDQRKRLFLLARLLDRVPKNHFKMRHWIQCEGGAVCSNVEEAKELKRGACGYAGCAMGWAMTSPAIRAHNQSASSLFESFGMQFAPSNHPGNRIFGPHRIVPPRTVAADIRRYLKDGTLPAR